MPRKSAAELSLAVPPPLPTRSDIVAPPGLIEPVRLRFVELVNAVHHEHFTDADVPLLVEYATACHLARQAAQAIQRDGAVIKSRPSAWLVVQEKSLRAMSALAMRLRLCPQGRLSAAQARKPSSRHMVYQSWSGDDR